MRETVLTTTLGRPELLFCCLKRIRAADPDISVLLFPDRGTWKDERLQQTAGTFGAQIIHVPDHSFYGNSYCAGEALRYVFNSGYDLVHYIEDDVFAKPDLFSWTRKQHEFFDDIFCSAGWVFNLHAPIDSGDYFVPWLYIPQFSIKREQLALIVEHLGQKYYENMQGWLWKRFPKFNDIDLCISHYEIDGLLQRVLMGSQMQVIWPSVAKVEHMGYTRSYGDTASPGKYEEIMEGAVSFMDRVKKIEELIADPYRRMRYFGRAIVEREIGREIPPRVFRYRMTVGEFETEFTSDLELKHLPRVINSVPRTAETVITSL